MSDFFNNLINDPQLQYGLGLLDSYKTGTPYTNAQAALQRWQETQRAQQQLEQTKELNQASIARMGAQTSMEQQQQDIARQQFNMQQQIIEGLKKDPRFASMFGGQQPQQPQLQQQDLSTQQPQQQPQQQQPVGKFGTPSAILKNLVQTESSGNPTALNPTSGAMGLGQFLPSTVKDLANQGYKFNPLGEPQQQVDAIDYYLQQLLKKNGGDWQKTLAEYGGFKTKDPTAYINKILPQQLAQVQQTIPQQQVGNPGLDQANLGAMLELAGMKGGQGMIDVGKMLQPQNVPGGSYQRDPSTGQLSFVPDPYKAAQIGQEQQKIGISQAELGLKQSAQAYEQQPSSGVSNLPQKAVDALNADRLKEATTEIEKSYQLNKEMPNQLMAIKRAQADIVNNPFVGSASGFKLAAKKAYTNLFPGVPLDPNVEKAEDFDAAMSIQWMKAAKKVDPNISDKGIDAIRAAFGSRANDPNALKNILQETYDAMNKSRVAHNSAVKQYTSKVGGDPYSRLIPETLPSPKATAALSANPTPQMRQFFDQKYGEGASIRALGQ